MTTCQAMHRTQRAGAPGLGLSAWTPTGSGDRTHAHGAAAGREPPRHATNQEDAMATLQDIETWRGRTLVDRDGDKIGKVEDVYLDRSSGEPEWVAVKTGLFGSNVSFVPIHGADTAGDDLRVAYEKDQVKDAPNVDPDGELSPEEERRLYQHYGRGDYDEWTADSEDRTEATYGRGDRDFDRDGDATGNVGRDTSGPTTDDAMTRSEEELDVGTQRRETGRARLRKY